MIHGNKKYFFEGLKKRGDTVMVETKNMQSLRNHLNLYKKDNDPNLEFDIAPVANEVNKYTVTRTSAMRTT